MDIRAVAVFPVWDGGKVPPLMVTVSDRGWGPGEFTVAEIDGPDWMATDERRRVMTTHDSFSEAVQHAKELAGWNDPIEETE